MIILLHTSKTMRHRTDGRVQLQQPQLLPQAARLAAYVQSLPPAQLATTMHISAALASKTHQLLAAWTTKPAQQSLAMDSFVGDIYKGLRASKLSSADRDYANQNLRILSGLYGILRPYDGICPYRLEMGYTLPGADFASLYTYWGSAIADCLPAQGLIVNLAAVEYSRTITPFVDAARVVAPHFLTINQATGLPTFVVVHAKIARGAFARWLITSRITSSADFSAFNDLGYRYHPELSTPAKPVFICQTFEGTGVLTMAIKP